MTENTPKTSDHTVSVSFDMASLDAAIRDQFIPALSKALETTVTEFMAGMTSGVMEFETREIEPIDRRVERLKKALSGEVSA